MYIVSVCIWQSTTIFCDGFALASLRLCLHRTSLASDIKKRQQQKNWLDVYTNFYSL